jgi:phosphoribosyl-AMP cyclohydrolase
MTETETETIAVDFGDDGLVPAVAQDAETGEVLMLAYVDGEALDRTLDTGEAHYYSRSRDAVWHKGESSGHVQRVDEVRVDCDGDALLYRVAQEGGACHTGYRSCFHRRVEDAAGDGTADGDGEGRVAVATDGERVFDPEAVYGEGDG